MKKKLFTILTILLASILFSCTGETSDNNEVNTCLYTFEDDSTTFEWTAYKTSEKAPVSGGFNEISVTSEPAEDPVRVIESIQFEINTASVETNVDDRNKKIAKHFFQTINTPTIKGKVASVGNDKAIVNITMNGVSIDVEGRYKLENDNFEFESVIDVTLWNALVGIDSLNEVCYDLHTGTDGVSKLWSEVKLNFNTSLVKNCD